MDSRKMYAVVGGAAVVAPITYFVWKAFSSARATKSTEEQIPESGHTKPGERQIALTCPDLTPTDILEYEGEGPVPVLWRTLFFPSAFPGEYFKYSCPEDLCRRPFKWQEQRYHVGRVLSLLHSSKKSIDCLMYMITSSRLAEHLPYAARKKEGFKSRYLLYEPYFADVILENRENDIELKLWNAERREGIGEMHMKAFIIDDRILVFGSLNWTGSAFRDNSENLIITSDPRYVQDFKEIFEELWSSENSSVLDRKTAKAKKYRPPNSHRMQARRGELRRRRADRSGEGN